MLFLLRTFFVVCSVAFLQVVGMAKKDEVKYDCRSDNPVVTVGEYTAVFRKKISEETPNKIFNAMLHYGIKKWQEDFLYSKDEEGNTFVHLASHAKLPDKLSILFTASSHLKDHTKRYWWINHANYKGETPPFLVFKDAKSALPTNVLKSLELLADKQEYFSRLVVKERKKPATCLDLALPFIFTKKGKKPFFNGGQHARVCRVLISAYDRKGYTLLHHFVFKRRCRLLKNVLKKECYHLHLDARGGESKNTALHCALLDNNIAMALLLIEKGASLDIKNEESKTSRDIITTSNRVFRSAFAKYL